MPIDRDEEYGKKLNVYINDPTERVRDWLKVTQEFEQHAIPINYVKALIDEIDRLREKTYIALRQDTDRQIIADSEQYNRGYNDAIETAVRKIEAEKVVEYDSSDREYNEAIEACRSKIVTLQQKR